jgi:methionine-rich copper-binding protein CopC
MRHLLLSTMLLAPAAASAHAILVQSQPAAQSSVPAGPTTLVLRYNSRIDQARSRLTLRGTNAAMVLPLEPDSPADTLAAQAELTPGTYVLHWQVLAVDGHMTRGDVRFTVVKQ